MMKKMKKQLHSRCLDLDTGHPWSISLQILRGQIDARFIRRHDTLVVLFCNDEVKESRKSQSQKSKSKPVEFLPRRDVSPAQPRRAGRHQTDIENYRARFPRPPMTRGG
jgi:hypothetical protein